MEIEPVETKSCPTGNPLLPRSEAILFTEYSCVKELISNARRGDNSIRSNVTSFLLIVFTTILKPRTYFISVEAGLLKSVNSDELVPTELSATDQFPEEY